MPSPTVSVAVVPRDRFSTIPACVANVVDTVTDDTDVHVVFGGAPAGIVDEVRSRFGDRVRIHETAEFLSTSTGRNIALEVCDTDLLAIVDSDSFPRPGWLEPLVERQVATGAGSVVGVILERPDAIHCAGTSFYVDEHDGGRFGWKVLHCYGMPYHDGCNLEAREVDYGEQHSHLVDVAAMRSIGGFDPAIGEGCEIDSGLTLQQGGHTSWFEPSSVTFFHFDGPVTTDDIEYFSWRWDAEHVLESYRAFEEKWGIDIVEGQSFRNFLGIVNSQVPRLPRRVTSPSVLRGSRVLRRVADGLSWLPYNVRNGYRVRRWARDWPHSG